MRDAEATAMSEDIVDATVPLKLLSVWRMPAARKQHPRTRRMLDRMLPSILAWTILISPCLNATIDTCPKLAVIYGVIDKAQTHDKFDSISESRIHQSTKRLTKLSRQLFCCETQEGSERDDGDEVEDEDGGRIPSQYAGEDADGDEDEEDIDVVAGEGRIGEVEDVLGERLYARLALVVLCAADERGLLMVEAAIRWCRHGMLLRWSSLVTTEAVEVALYVFCQAMLLAMILRRCRDRPDAR